MRPRHGLAAEDQRLDRGQGVMVRSEPGKLDRLAKL